MALGVPILKRLRVYVIDKTTVSVVIRYSVNTDTDQIGVCTFIMKLFVAFNFALLFYVHGKHLRSCRDGQLT